MSEHRLLQVESLTTHLGGVEKPTRAVDAISFDIMAGETFALLGESGCGKSMSALSLMRLLPAAARIMGGSVRFEGQELLRLSESRMREVRGGGMAMVFQEPMTSLNPVLTVCRQITEAMRTRRSNDASSHRDKAIELLYAVGIPSPEQRIDDYPHQLSGGMKQRVMMAIALANEPKLLIADEPTTALDVTIQAQVLDLIRDLQRQRGMAVMLITHDLGVVNQLADRVAVMYAGQIVERARRGGFFSRPLHPYSQKLFDSVPTMAKRNRELDVIQGSVPSLQTSFTGCRFVFRCQRGMDLCRHQIPVWARPDNGGEVLCHLYTTEADDGRQSPQQSEVEVEPAVCGGSGTALLRVNDLKIHFPIRTGLLKRVTGSVRAVDGVELDISKGRTLALVGESGCGKTTVGKAILQLIRPTAGSVEFENTELTLLSNAKLRQMRADFQIIFQDPYASMNPRMLVGEIVSEGLRAQSPGSNQASRWPQVRDLLDKVGLAADSVNRYPHEFSGGQRQRISIARALAVEPKLIVCDEPTSALDVSVQAQILNLLRALQRQLGISYLFITHDISVVAYLAHDVAVMYLGRIVERGAADAVLSRPRHPYTQALMSAVPGVDADERGRAIRLKGDMPSPSNPPPGCFFHPRCKQAMACCRTEYPAQTRVDLDHVVNCHLYEEGI